MAELKEYRPQRGNELSLVWSRARQHRRTRGDSSSVSGAGHDDHGSFSNTEILQSSAALTLLFLQKFKLSALLNRNDAHELAARDLLSSGTTEIHTQPSNPDRQSPRLLCAENEGAVEAKHLSERKSLWAKNNFA